MKSSLKKESSEETQSRDVVNLKDYRVQLGILYGNQVDNSRVTLPMNGRITNIDTIIEHFDVTEINIHLGDGSRLRLIRDGNAVPGQNVDIYI